MWNSSGFGNSRLGSDQQQTGGFLNNTKNFPSPSKFEDEKKKVDRVTNIVPCTVAQLFKVPDTEDHLVIGSVSAHIITIVGLVHNVDVQSTKISYVVDDMSGPPIEVQLWIGENEDIGRNSVQVGNYVRVTGALRIIRGKRHIIAFKISPIKEVNEITVHLLEIIHTSMAIAIKDSADSNPMKNQTFVQPKYESMATNPTNSSGINSSVSFITGEQSLNQSNFTPPGLTRPQQMVLQIIASCKDVQGAYIGNIFGELKSLNKKTIQDAMEFLSNEGHIYSTIDDNHYKSTDG